MRCLGLIALAAVIGFSFAACGDGGSTHTHSWGAWRSNATQHWKECSCGEEYGRANHTFNGDVCSVCGYNVTTNGTTYSLDGDWQGSSGIAIITISGSTGVYKQLDTDDPVLLDAISKGYIGVGKQYLRNLTKTGDLTWTGQIIYVNYNTSSPVATGTSWRDCTITMNANGQTIQITSTGLSGTTTITYTRTTTTSGERDSRLVNAPGEAWILVEYNIQGMIFKADGTCYNISTNNELGVWETWQTGTWSTMENNRLIYMDAYIDSYTVNTTTLTTTQSGKPTFTYTKTPVTISGVW
jgi:hypothetical protein